MPDLLISTCRMKVYLGVCKACSKWKKLCDWIQRAFQIIRSRVGIFEISQLNKKPSMHRNKKRIYRTPVSVNIWGNDLERLSSSYRMLTTLKNQSVSLDDNIQHYFYLWKRLIFFTCFFSSFSSNILLDQDFFSPILLLCAWRLYTDMRNLQF